jgi:boron transporter
MTPAGLDPSPSYTLPGTAASHLRTSTRSPRPQRKPWQSRRAQSFRSTQSQTCPVREEEVTLSRTQSRASTIRKRKWWKIRLFRGMVNDVRRRAPFYWSDWKDAWDYRVVPATVYMYFAKYDRPAEPYAAICCLLRTLSTVHS